MPAIAVTNKMTINLRSAVWLFSTVSLTACLQLDAPLPAGPIHNAGETPRPSPTKISSPPKSSLIVAQGDENPDQRGSPESAGRDPPKGAARAEEADAQVPPNEPSWGEDAIDATPLVPPGNGSPPDAISTEDEANLESLCPPGSAVFFEGIRYVCGRNGVAYDPLLVWLLST